LEQQHTLVERWRALLVEVQGTEAKEFPLYGVAIRELLDLAQRSQHDEAG
jgi:glutamate dehydrogenase